MCSFFSESAGLLHQFQKEQVNVAPIQSQNFSSGEQKSKTLLQKRLINNNSLFFKNCSLLDKFFRRKDNNSSNVFTTGGFKYLSFFFQNRLKQ